MCHHHDHDRTDEHNDYGDQRRHSQACHGSYHFLWFLFPFLFFPFFAFHAWYASGFLFWFVPVILFALGMKKAASRRFHRREALAMPKDAPFSTSLSSRSDEHDAQLLLPEPSAQEGLTQQEGTQQEEPEYSSPQFVDEQPQTSYPEAQLVKRR